MMNFNQRRILFFRAICELVRQAAEKGIALLPFAYYRTMEEELKNFQEGKSLIDPTRRPTRHMLWLAIDFVIIKDGKAVWDRIPEYEILGQIWESLGGRWGGNWKGTPFDDIFHFEYSDKMEALYVNGNNWPGTSTDSGSDSGPKKVGG
jgi:hypothetical protein